MACPVGSRISRCRPALDPRARRPQAENPVNREFVLNDFRSWARVASNSLTWTNDELALLMRAAELAKEVADVAGSEQKTRLLLLEKSKVVFNADDRKYIRNGEFDEAAPEVARSVCRWKYRLEANPVSVRSVLKTVCLSVKKSKVPAIAAFFYNGGAALVFRLARVSIGRHDDVGGDLLSYCFQILWDICSVDVQLRKLFDDRGFFYLTMFRLMNEAMDKPAWRKALPLKRFRKNAAALLARSARFGATTFADRRTACRRLGEILSCFQNKCDDPVLCDIFHALTPLGTAMDISGHMAVDLTLLVDNNVIMILDESQRVEVLAAALEFLNETIKGTGRFHGSQGYQKASNELVGISSTNFQPLIPRKEKVTKLLTAVVALCVHVGPVVWRGALDLLSKFVNLYSLKDCLLDAGAIEMFVDLLKRRRICHPDFKDTIQPLQNLCMKLHNPVDLSRAGVHDALWNALVEYAANMPVGNRLAMQGGKSVFQLSMLNRESVSEQPLFPIITSAIVDQWFYDHELAGDTGLRQDPTALVIAMEVLAMSMKNSYGTNIEVQRTLLLILGAKPPSTDSTDGALHKLAINAFTQNICESASTYAALVEQCVPSETYILSGSDFRGEYLKPFRDATGRFGSGELVRGLHGRGRISPPSAAVAIPILFEENYAAEMKRLMISGPGLDELLKLVFFTSASPAEKKACFRWLYSVHSLYILALRPRKFVSSIEYSLTTEVPGCFCEPNMEDLWSRVRPGRWTQIMNFSPSLDKKLGLPEPPKFEPSKVGVESEGIPEWHAYRTEAFYQLSPQKIFRCLPGKEQRVGFEDKEPEQSYLLEVSHQEAGPCPDGPDGPEEPPPAKRQKIDRQESPSREFTLVFRDGQFVASEKDLTERSDFFKHMIGGNFQETATTEIHLENICNKLAMEVFLDVVPPDKVYVDDASSWQMLQKLKKLGFELEEVVSFREVCDYLMRFDVSAVLKRDFERRMVEEPGSCLSLFQVAFEREAANLPAVKLGCSEEETDIKIELVKFLLVGPMTLTQRAEKFKYLTEDEAVLAYVMPKIIELIKEAYA